MKVERMVKGAGGALLGAAVVVAALSVGAPSASAAPVGCTSDFYTSSSTTSIVKRDPSGALTTINTGTLVVLSLALNPVDGYLYAVSSPGSIGNHVFRIEADGTSTDLGVVTGLPTNTTFSGAAFTPDGALRLLPNWRVDLSTMTATAAGPTGVNGDFAFLEGSLYTWAPGRLMRIDPDTGASSNVTVSGISSFGSAWASAGHLYVSQNSTISEVLGYDTATPTLHPVGTTATNGDGASCYTAESPFFGAADDDYAATPIGTTGGTTASVFANDLAAGAAVSAAGVTAVLESDGGLAGAALAADGTLAVPAAPAGTYTLGYRACLVSDPLVCDRASVAVLIQAPAPAAVPAGPILPATGTDAAPLLLVALGALGLGAVALLQRRRRAS